MSKWRVLSDLAALDSFRPQWHALLLRAGASGSLFAGPAWVTAWLETHANRVTPALIVAGDVEAPVGLLALCRDRAGGLRTAGAPLVDRTAVLALPGCRGPTLTALARGVADLIRPSESLELPLVAENDRDLIDALSARCSVELARHDACPCIADAAERRETGRRRRLADERRRLERRARVAVRHLRSPEGCQDALALLLANRQDAAVARGRWSSYHPWTREASFGQFLGRYCRAAGPYGVAVAELTVDDRVAASALMLQDAETDLLYALASDPHRPVASAGLMLVDELIAQALQASPPRRFEFGLGDERYKYDLGARDEWRSHWRAHAR